MNIIIKPVGDDYEVYRYDKMLATCGTIRMASELKELLLRGDGVTLSFEDYKTIVNETHKLIKPMVIYSESRDEMLEEIANNSITTAKRMFTILKKYIQKGTRL